jgi:catechol 2,3-dioxygenase-like lactoylglutathione lyase family enzyme
MAGFPAPKEGIVLTHFVVSDNVERSRRFYTEVLGGESVRAGEPSFVALANGWIIINVGGGPTDDKPTVTLETPPDPDRVSSSSTSGWRIFRRSMTTGAHVERNFSRHHRTAEPRPAATSVIRMGT